MAQFPTTGSRVSGNAQTRSFGRLGTVTRVIDADGELGGLVEIRWDGERRPSRSAGFEAVRDLTVLAVDQVVRHRSGLVVFG